MLRECVLYVIGIGFLALAKAKNFLQGYATPKPFAVSETQRCVEYDIGVVDHWLSRLHEYTGGAVSLSGKNVLELGPGSDLGTGICLLSKGCAQYNACDVNNLMKSTPDSFYEQLIEKLQQGGGDADLGFLRRQLQEAQAGNPSRLRYVVRSDFDIVSAFGESAVDLVFSQAAFEHFDDIAATISQITAVCRPGAIVVAEIDLQTHSRWIRDKDPNNIYRYPDCLYDLFWFRGIPNRVRPFQYKETFERHGWTGVSITPLVKLKDRHGSCLGMNRRFADEKNQMGHLTVMLCARKGGVAA